MRYILSFILGMALLIIPCPGFCANNPAECDDCDMTVLKKPASSWDKEKEKRTSERTTLLTESTQLWAAAEDGGVFLWKDTMLYRYDKELTLKKSIVLVLSLPNSPSLTELLRPRCAFCPKIRRSMVATNDGGVILWVDNYLLKYDKDLKIVKQVRLPFKDKQQNR